METLSIIQLKDIIGDSRYTIIDLRERKEYIKWHINGAVNIPFSILEKGHYQLNKNKRIVFYCYRGNHSIMAASKYEKLGYNTCAVVGKIEDFEKYKDL